MRFPRDPNCILALTVSLAMASAASAQEAPASQQSGIFNDIGRLLQSPADLLPSFSKPDAPPAGEAVKPQASPPPAPAAAEIAGETPREPARDATRFLPGMVTGRELCPAGANGAPDCQAGSDRLCRSKGYKSGKSLNTDSAFSCSARIARAGGGKPCGNEHFVTSAFCN